jgi:hypothetical protein
MLPAKSHFTQLQAKKNIPIPNGTFIGIGVPVARFSPPNQKAFHRIIR